MKETLFPVPVLTAGLLLGKPGIALLVDLPAGLDEVWLPLMADAFPDWEAADAIGYLQLKKRVTQRPGLSTFAVVAVRPAHDPPPNPATYQTLFQHLSPEAYVERLQLANALQG